MAWYLFLLVAVGVIAVFFWDYRRKAARRDAASKERFEQIFKGRAPAASPESSPSLPAVVPPVAAGVAAPKVPPVTVLPRGQFLGQAEALVYFLLKAGVPGHEVFANVTLASVVGVPDHVTGSAREQQLRRLMQYQLDFVVCDKNLRVIAAIELDTAQAADAAGVRRFKADCLQAAGVRLVRLDPSAPPRPEEIGPLLSGS